MQASIWVGHSVPGRTVLLSVLYLLVTVPLAWRRSYPLLVLVLVSLPPAIQAAATGNGVEGGVPMIAGVIAIYSVGAFGRLREAVVAIVVLAATLAVHDANDPSIRGDRLQSNALFWLAAVTIWLAGVYVGRHREAKALERRAKELELEGVERDREALEQRLRIARELHDVIAHTVSVMVVQADAADDLLDTNPEVARRSIRNIQRTGRDSMRELQRLLAVIRDDEAVTDDLSPQPTIARLGPLVDRLDEAGVSCDLEIEGDIRTLPAGIDLSAYRIVQEALTNVFRHSRAQHAHVRLRYRPTAIELEIADDGPAVNHTEGRSKGRGLVGMRERAALCGGRFEAGPRPEGGFVVSATLPLGVDA